MPPAPKLTVDPLVLAAFNPDAPWEGEMLNSQALRVIESVARWCWMSPETNQERGGKTMGVVEYLRNLPATPERWAPKSSGRVYYIGCTETLRVKIGFTSGCPYERMAKLQTGSSARLVMLGSIRADPAMEKSTHYRFRRDRIRGEWFKLSPELYKHLVYLAWEESGQREASPDHRIIKFARNALSAVTAQISTPKLPGSV